MNPTSLLRRKVINKLSTIYDPELPVNVLDLGIIYGIDVDDDHVLTLTMTLTTPNCPAAQTFPNTIRHQMEQLEELQGVDIKMVWEPPWQRSMMAQSARKQLGI